MSAAAAHVSRRAGQGVPPALRRAVLARDRHRCQVPGCCNVLFLDVHHIVARSDGGRNEPRNLLTLCTAHHRAVHRGELVIDPNAAPDQRFRHADGTAYGSASGGEVIDKLAKVFSALRGLGFREREASAVLAELREAASVRAANVGELLCEALRRIQRMPV